jgi:hypothetical protein
MMLLDVEAMVEVALVVITDRASVEVTGSASEGSDAVGCASGSSDVVDSASDVALSMAVGSRGFVDVLGSFLAGGGMTLKVAVAPHSSIEFSSGQQPASVQ